jgi:hypothetical protein
MVFLNKVEIVMVTVHGGSVDYSNLIETGGGRKGLMYCSYGCSDDSRKGRMDDRIVGVNVF